MAEESKVDNLIMTAAEAHARFLPLSKLKNAPVGHEPGATFAEARRVRKATLTGATKLSPPVKPTAATTPVAPDELLKFIIDDDD